MKRSGKALSTKPTKSKDATLADQKLKGEAVELEKLLKQFAYQPGYFEQSDKETREVKVRLEDLLKARWGTFDRDVVQKGRALLEWVLLCPPLLAGQPGFEWVQESFIKLLQRRLHYWDVGHKAVRDREGRWVGVDDQLFWGIAKSVRGKLNRGHPKSVAKDYARANRVMNFMMFKSTATGQQITESEAVEMVAQYEVRQRVLDGAHFLGEVATVSKVEARRRVASWGIDQRAGAVSFLRVSCSSTIEDAEKLIDDWNAKQKRRRAKEFLEKKHGYSAAQAHDLVAQWEIDKSLGKDSAARFLVSRHGYEEVEAAKIVNRWGNTGELDADPSPISRSLRVVERQGLWTRLGDGVFSNKEDAQKVMDLLLKQVHRKSEEGKADEFIEEEERELKRLTTKLWQS